MVSNLAKCVLQTWSLSQVLQDKEESNTLFTYTYTCMPTNTYLAISLHLLSFVYSADMSDQVQSFLLILGAQVVNFFQNIGNEWRMKVHG